MRYPIKQVQTGMNNPILRTVSDEIEEINEEIIEFANKLLMAMRKNK
ncbi:MAG: hypothetical protein WCH65_06490 [bacterium]